MMGRRSSDSDSDQDIWDYKSVKRIKPSDTSKSSTGSKTRGVGKLNIAQITNKSSKSARNAGLAVKPRSKDSFPLANANKPVKKTDNPKLVKGRKPVTQPTTTLCLESNTGELTQESKTVDNELNDSTDSTPFKPPVDQGSSAKFENETPKIQQNTSDLGNSQGLNDVKTDENVRRTPGSSRKRKAPSKTPVQRKKFDGNCPHCQMPFEALTIESPRWHTMECMDLPLIAIQGISVIVCSLSSLYDCVHALIRYI